MKNRLANIFHHEITAWVVLAVSLAITVMGWHISGKYVTRRAEDRFHFEVEDAKHRITQRMQSYEQVLRGGAALFAASRQVTRQQWRSYVSTLRIDEFFPGIQGVGFSLMISPAHKALHEQSIRAEGYPDYVLYPAGERAQYSAIVYLEPFSGRNLRAFGYDMYSEPVRRAAMREAMETGKAAVSGHVTLMQETHEDVQAGFLMYLPVYRAGWPTDTVEARRAALLGFVYSPFRINDLMRGILGKNPANLDFELFDGYEEKPENRLYDSKQDTLQNQGKARHIPRYSNDTRIKVAGHTWTLCFSSRPQFEAATASNQPAVIALGGFTVDILLFGIVLSLSRQKKEMARKTTELKTSAAALREREAQYRAVIETSQDGFWIVNSEGRLTEVNETYCRMSGYSREELLRMRVTDLEALEKPEETAAHIAKVIRNGYDRFETMHRGKDGRLWPVEITVSHWQTTEGLFVFARDITWMKAMEASRNKAEEAIRNLAYYDPLTSLANRRLLMDRLHVAIVAIRRSQHYGALLFIDMDNFKALNDTFGHDTGDLLLIEVAKRLLSCVREADTVARLGGDEFIVMLDDAGGTFQEAAAHIETVGEKILVALNRPYELGEHAHCCTPSIGVALFHGKEESAEELLKRADQAMYQAKAAGRNTIHYFNPSTEGETE